MPVAPGLAQTVTTHDTSSEGERGMVYRRHARRAMSTELANGQLPDACILGRSLTLSGVRPATGNGRAGASTQRIVREVWYFSIA